MDGFPDYCGECKHWDKTGDRLIEQALRFQYRAPGYGFCLRTEQHSESNITNMPAFATDASGFAAVLITSPKYV